MILEIAVGIFMIGTALNLLEVHPIFRYFIIQPPKFLYKTLRKQSKSHSFFAPILLGIFTIFIPCGTTQAMMALAVTTGRPLYGAVTMFLFILGTTPLFFILGFIATSFSAFLSKPFLRVAAAFIIILAVFNIDNAIALAGSRITLQGALQSFYCTALVTCTKSDVSKLPLVDNVSITIDSRGYTPNEIRVKAGSFVKVRLENKGGGGCAAAFTIPSLNVRKLVTLGAIEHLAFQAPSTPGDIPFMCSMNMYRGTIHVEA